MDPASACVAASPSYDMYCDSNRSDLVSMTTDAPLKAPAPKFVCLCICICVYTYISYISAETYIAVQLCAFKCSRMHLWNSFVYEGENGGLE